MNKNFGPISADTQTTMATYSGGSWNYESSLSDGNIPSAGWAASVQKATYGELVKAGIIKNEDAGMVTDDETKIGSTTQNGTKIKYLSSGKVPYASQEFGHVVHWILYLDTSKVDEVVDTDLTVTVSAKDYGEPGITDAEGFIYDATTYLYHKENTSETVIFNKKNTFKTSLIGLSKGVRFCF